jgi:hypothetical protein
MEKKQLILDVKTRWGSQTPMITRYLEIKNEILKALTYFNEAGKFTTKYDKILQDLTVTLKPVNDLITYLSGDNLNIVQAEKAVQ